MVLRMANPWKHPDTGVYYLRKRVPKDLIGVVGAKLIKVSLRTKYPSEAKVLHREKDQEIEARWANLRVGAQYLDDAQVEAIAGEIYRDRLAMFGKVRTLAFPNAHWAMLSVICDEADGTSKKPTMTRERALSFHKVDVDPRLKAKGLLVDEDSYQRLLVAVNRALKQACALYFRQMQGDWRPDPDADRFPTLELPSPHAEKASSPALTLDDAWAILSPDYASATCRRWRPILDGLMLSAKKDDLRAITTADIEAWVDAALASGTSTRRSFKRNNLTAVKTAFSTLKKGKHLTANPAADVFVNVPKRQKGREMRGFWNEEAFKILQASLDAPPKKLSRNFAVARRWVPWLCAYTGARVNEITQARACDVKFVEDYWCIYITPEAGTQKTCSARLVPLHADLIEQGFLEFARTKKGQEPLFASTIQRGKTSPSELVGAHLAKWVRNMGIEDPSVAPNHGWRHRFKTEARGRRIQLGLVDAIQGHAPATEGGAYGAYPPRVLGPEIEKLPTITLPSKQREAA